MAAAFKRESRGVHWVRIGYKPLHRKIRPSYLKQFLKHADFSCVEVGVGWSGLQAGGVHWGALSLPSHFSNASHSASPRFVSDRATQLHNHTLQHRGHGRMIRQHNMLQLTL
jgi:hypothetical protein